MQTAFTPIESLLGGGMIGLAAVLLMLFLGRVMGATGILGGAVIPSSREDWAWRAAMIVGMALGPLAYQGLMGAAPAFHVPVSTPMLLIGGVLVGIGATFGSGCTSGHGVCGLARLSRRSLAATLTFMAAAAVTVFIGRHGIGG